jgi:hypothetical protein
MVGIMVEMERNYITAEYFRTIQMGKMPDGKVMYTLDGRPVTEEPEGSPEEKHYKRIINQVSGYVREVCQQMTQTVPKAIVHCMVMQVGGAGWWVVGALVGVVGVEVVAVVGVEVAVVVVGVGVVASGGRLQCCGSCNAVGPDRRGCFFCCFDVRLLLRVPPASWLAPLLLCPHSILSDSRRPSLPLPACLSATPLQSKDKLLEDMQAGVAGNQEAALKRLLGEDEAVMKRRETLTLKLDMLKKAQAELTTVDV